MKKYIYIILVIIIVLAAVFFISRSKPSKETATPPATPVAENKAEKIVEDQSAATAKNYQESSEKYKYQIAVVYPFFDSLADKKILDSINSQIDKSVQLEVDKYIAEARKNKIAPSFGYLTGNYTYSVSDGKVLSVKLEMEKLLSGGADPSNYSVTLNYDLENGRQIL
ncbi:MAG: hypothetical protein WCV59_02250 [Parcubacteria group bacterium]|jgi:hypothetical protein